MAVLVKNEMQYVDKFLFWINYFQVTEEFYLTDFLIFFFCCECTFEYFYNVIVWNKCIKIFKCA